MAEADLDQIAKRLSKDGPHKIEGTPRRVRGLLGGQFVFDTTSACYVWEHPYYPYFYIPTNAFAQGVLTYLDSSDGRKQYRMARLDASGKSTERVIVFDGTTGKLAGLVRIEVSSLDGWFVEDDKLLGSHPKDPYKRVETVTSSREVHVQVGGVTVARSSRNVFLFETMLVPRYYLATVDVDWRLLTESDTTSFCPYKGMANYYNVTVNGKEIKDAAWYYKYPTMESSLIAGRLCFYHEKVDVLVDGVRLQ